MDISLKITTTNQNNEKTNNSVNQQYTSNLNLNLEKNLKELENTIHHISGCNPELKLLDNKNKSFQQHKSGIPNNTTNTRNYNTIAVALDREATFTESFNKKPNLLDNFYKKHNV